MLLSVIIVNYNVKYFLEQCLYSLRKACQEIESEIIVIDNNSTDNSRSWLEEKFSEVKFTWQTTNSGFGKASNFALKQATGDYVLFLNPDTILAEDSLQLCLQEMKKDSSIGALGVRMIDGSGMFLKESKRGLPTASRSFFKMSGLGSLFPGSKMFAGYYAGHLPNNETHPVDVLAGAFLLLSRKAVTITNGFDEDFFMYGEDVDISYRIQKAGLKNIYFPGTTIIHFKGESTQKYSAEYNQHFYGAMRLFTKKHFANKKGLLFITGAAINAGKILASFKGIYAKGKERKLTPRPLTTAVVAGQQKFDECLHLIKYATTPLAVAGRIAVATSDTGTALGRVEDINAVLSKNKIEQVIFCEGDQDFKAIIAQCEKTPTKINLLFHANKSSSIIGSSNRNKKGMFISKPLVP